jgi:transposase
MAGAYSTDLRERVLRACERGRPSRAKIAALFQVAESTVYRWLQAWRVDGRRAAKPHAGGPAPRLDAAALEKLKAIVAEANDLTLVEYATKLKARTGVAASGPTICRALQKLDLPRKKDAAGARAGSYRPRRRARPGATSWPRSTRNGWCSWMRAGSTPVWSAPMPVPRGASGRWARCPAGTGSG